MTSYTLHLDNIKCDGCVKKITATLEQYPSIQNIQVIIPTGTLTFEGTNIEQAKIVSELNSIGFPETKKKGFFSKLQTLINK